MQTQAIAGNHVSIANKTHSHINKPRPLRGKQSITLLISGGILANKVYSADRSEASYQN
jgi:hypothetical protein